MCFAIEFVGDVDAIDAIAIHLELVEAQFINDVNKDRNHCADAERQSRDVDECI